MPANDEDYHVRRECEHCALAETAATEKAKLAHIAMADQHAALLGNSRVKSTSRVQG